MSETSIVSVKASVMIYDDVSKKWLPSGTSAGISKVNIYQHNENNSFRVVGRKVDDHEVVINCAIAKNIKYNTATPTFHQWRDYKCVYGLNFNDTKDADVFAKAMSHTMNVLNNAVKSEHTLLPPPPSVASNEHFQNSDRPLHQQQFPPKQQNMYHQPSQIMSQNNNHYDENTVGYNNNRTRNNIEDVANDRRTFQQSQLLHTPSSVSTMNIYSPLGNRRIYTTPTPVQSSQPPPLPTSVPPMSSMHVVPQMAPPPPPVSSIPPTLAPPPPIVPPVYESISTMKVPLTVPSTHAPAPPPPPMPTENICNEEGGTSNSLASQLQTMQLKRSSNKPCAENNEFSTTNSSSDGSKAGGRLTMMDEMAQKLARRKAAMNNQDTAVVTNDNESHNNTGNFPFNNKQQINNKFPKPIHKSNPTSSKDTPKMNDSDGNSSKSITKNDITNAMMEQFKQELFSEIKNEMLNLKQEIINVVKAEFSYFK